MNGFEMNKKQTRVLNTHDKIESLYVFNDFFERNVLDRFNNKLDTLYDFVVGGGGNGFWIGKVKTED